MAVPKVKRVLVVGAGCSGLTAIKCCLDEGLQPVCLEKSGDIGGLWNFSDNVSVGTSSIYKSLVINTSKNMMMFSDFPAPDSFPPFLTHTKVLEYFRLYAQRFDLLRYIQFKREVRDISKTPNYEVTGQWRVTYILSSGSKDDGSIMVVEEVFDGVMICSGHHSFPYRPKLDGLEKFKGEVIHSHSYKDAAPYQDKRVVILGMGNSAADIACDLAKSASQVILSSRRGAWIVPRTAFWGRPADMLANSRVVFTLPLWLLDRCVQIQANFRIDHHTYGLRPRHGVLSCHPTINDELPIHLVSGRVQTKPRVIRVDTDGVWFQDETFLPCDVIVLATGYEYRLDFVAEDVIKLENNLASLYKFMFPPHLHHPTLTAIGLIQAIGAAMPISEMQSRWYAKLLAGKLALPSQQEMLADIASKRARMSDMYLSSRRHTMQTFWIDYMDQIASKIDAKPNLWRMLFSDPKLALKCYLGPCLPAQYRLRGPGIWREARSFILSANADQTTRSDSSSCETSNVKEPINEPTEAQSKTGKEQQLTYDGLLTMDSCSNGGCPNAESKYGVSSNGKTDAGAGLDDSPANSHIMSCWWRWSPRWMTIFNFYIILVFLCCGIWMLSVLFHRTGTVLNVVDGVVGIHQ